VLGGLGNFCEHRFRLIVDLNPSQPTIVYGKYADDLSCVIPASVSEMADREMGHIKRWADDNKLKINLSKTKEIVITSSAK